MNDFILREVRTMPEFEALVKLQQDVWGMSAEAATSPYMMMAVSHNGGVIIGAEMGGKLVGFCFGFVAWRGDSPFLWSHMTGVLPDFRGQGIGFRLKHAQRKWALEHGYSIICWTFDPIQHGNANFNFRRLGTVSDTYHVDHYGEMTDEINAGLASDRLEVRWHLNDERIAASAEGGSLDNVITHDDDGAFLLRADENGVPLRSPESILDHDFCFVEVPCQINALKRSDIEKARRWQLALRRAIQQAFKQDFLIVDFASQGDRGWYVLKRS